MEFQEKILAIFNALRARLDSEEGISNVFLQFESPRASQPAALITVELHHDPMSWREVTCDRHTVKFYPYMELEESQIEAFVDDLLKRASR